MKLILINGSTCAGKSTLVKGVLKQRHHFYWLSFDTLKWSFSQYDRDKHGLDVLTVMFAVAETVCSLQYDIICDSVLRRENREQLIALTTKYGYEVVEINIEAAYDVLSQRFDDRVARAQADPSIRISNLSRERFHEIYELYEEHKNPSVPTIRTDQHSVEENIEALQEIIGKNTRKHGKIDASELPV